MTVWPSWIIWVWHIKPTLDHGTSFPKMELYSTYIFQTFPNQRGPSDSPFGVAWSISTCTNASCRILATGSLHPISTSVAMVCAVPKAAKPGRATSRIGANLSRASCRKAACWLRPVGGASVNNLAKIRAQQCRTCLLLGATPLASPMRRKVKRSSARQCLESTARSANSSAASTDPLGALLPPPSTPSSKACAIRITATSISLGKDSAMTSRQTQQLPARPTSPTSTKCWSLTPLKWRARKPLRGAPKAWARHCAPQICFHSWCRLRTFASAFVLPRSLLKRVVFKMERGWVAIEILQAP